MNSAMNQCTCMSYLGYALHASLFRGSQHACMHAWPLIASEHSCHADVTRQQAAQSCAYAHVQSISAAGNAQAQVAVKTQDTLPSQAPQLVA